MALTSVEQRLERCVEAVRAKVDFVPKLALILGSGLGEFAESIRVEAMLPYSEIPDFPRSTVDGHKGRFVFGYVEEIPVVIMQGRVHYYEGYSMEEVVLPTRLMRRLGAEILFLTNASGSLNPEFRAGDFMLITDQIMNFVPSPLIGPNAESLGTRFPDVTELYTPELREQILAAAQELGIEMRQGVYVQTSGPNFETAAEVRMFHILGGDAVGMSTACEAIAARHMGMKICGISCVTNEGTGLSKVKLSAEDVTVTAARVAPLFRALLRESIVRIGAMTE